MTSNKSTVAILGAGITGLTVAYALRKKGINVTVYEKRDSVGGMIHTSRQDGWLLELGPNTLMVRSEKIWNLLHKLDLDNQLLEANRKSKKRFIVKDGNPTPLPMSLWDFIGTGLLSGSAKLRLLKEPFIDKGENDDESIARFVERRLGKEVLDYAVNPFVSGIFAGDPKKLSAKHTFSMLHELEQKHGSIFKGMLKREKKASSRKALISFKNGLQELPKALHEAIGDSVRLNHCISGISKENKSWSIYFEDNPRTEHDIIISTLPTHALSVCLQHTQVKGLISKLSDLPYAPVSVLHLGFKRNKINHPLDGFGMLIPEVENFKILGTLFSSSLFPGRAPEGSTLLTVFIGGVRNPWLAQLSKDQLVPKVQQELNLLLGISGSPEFISHTFWEKAIPQYEVGYDQYLAIMDQIETELPGLHIAGNIRGGVSVPDCIEGGLKMAEKIVNEVS